MSDTNCADQALSTPIKCPSNVSIKKLSDEVLLNIFRYYLDASPQRWPWLAHICRKWRLLVFESQLALRLQLLCTHGTPVLKVLDCWPALPIVVEYEGTQALDTPVPEDEDNIVAALQRTDRVSSVHLTVTKSLLQKITSIEKPFSTLEELVLRCEDFMELGSPRAFRWCPRLRSLYLSRVSFSSIPQLLYSSRHLVNIRLHNIADIANFSPEVLVNALSKMDQLQSLTLYLRSSASCPDVGMLSSSAGGKRVVFPSLTHFKFRGTSGFFNRFIVRIDPPLLRDIEITFSGRLSLVSKLREFMERIGMQKSHLQAEVLFSDDAISISFSQPGALMYPKLRISIRPSNWQLFSIFELCNRLSALLSGVEELHIHATRLSSGQDKMNCEDWAKLIHLFGGTKRIHIGGKLSTDIVLSLELYRTPTLLPSLHTLCIREPWSRYAPLREAVVSLMVCHRCSERRLQVEYERQAACSQGMMIEILPDDVLLSIFRLCLEASPKSWPELAHVCQAWRQIILNSPLGLDLRLYCTHGTPVLKTMEYWPPLPLVVKYGGTPMLNPPAPEDEENIMVALKQSGRVGSISLTITNSLLKNLSTISDPFSELEQLILISQDNVQLTLPSSFQWGPRLRTLHSTRIAIPTLPRRLSPTAGLVDLQLHEIPISGYFPPDSFANTLSEMSHLETLSLHFLSLPPRRKVVSLPPQPVERSVLPLLTCLKYRGTSKYLDSFVARIDAPHLEDMDITFFYQPTMDTLQLDQFVERIETQKYLSQGDIVFSESAVSIHFTQPDGPTRLTLQISCKQSDWQLASMAQILHQFTHIPHRVENLSIDATQPPSGQDVVGGEQWMDLVRTFGCAKNFRVAGEFTQQILLHTFGQAGGDNTTVLPALRHLHIMDTLTMNERLLSFTSSRLLSGCPVQVDAPSHRCHICRTCCKEEWELKIHFVFEHAYRLVCSHCGDFDCTMTLYHFHDHLERMHFKEHFSFDTMSHLYQHTTLYAPDVSTMVTAMDPQ